MPVTGDAIRVEGLSRLIRDMKKLESELPKEIKAEMKLIADHVAEDAQDDVSRRGLVDSGKMRKKIMGKARQNGAVIQSKAKSPRKGYPYPAIFEFGGRARSMKRKSFGPGGEVTNRSAIGARLAASGPALGAFGEFGPQAILLPAVQRNTEYTVEALTEMLDRLSTANGFD